MIETVVLSACISGAVAWWFTRPRTIKNLVAKRIVVVDDAGKVRLELYGGALSLHASNGSAIRGVLACSGLAFYSAGHVYGEHGTTDTEAMRVHLGLDQDDGSGALTFYGKGMPDNEPSRPEAEFRVGDGVSRFNLRFHDADGVTYLGEVDVTSTRSPNFAISDSAHKIIWKAP
jgi:hypothetical protein